MAYHSSRDACSSGYEVVSYCEHLFLRVANRNYIVGAAAASLPLVKLCIFRDAAATATATIAATAAIALTIAGAALLLS